MEKCLNCDTEFTGNYCNNCGQKRTRGDLTIKMVFSDFVQSVFLFDSSLRKTLIGLLLKPGSHVKSYLEGKRKKYFPPFQFFLLFMTIYLLMLTFFGDAYFEYVERVENQRKPRPHCPSDTEPDPVLSPGNSETDLNHHENM